MRVLSALFILAVLAAPSDAAGPVDLKNIPRTIAKEPVYQDKPGYCLTVFGPEARTRVWLVLDGDALYVDRNANGALTDDGPAVMASANAVHAWATSHDYSAVTIHDDKSNAEYELQLSRRETQITTRRTETNYILTAQVGGISQYAYGTFAERNEEAPVLHFDGPLALGIDASRIVLGRNGAVLMAWVGVRGLVEGKTEVRTRLPFDVVPPDVHPVAEILFPSKDASGEPISIKVVLNQRC